MHHCQLRNKQGHDLQNNVFKHLFILVLVKLFGLFPEFTCFSNIM